MTSASMPKVISAGTARTKFSQILRQAKEKQDRFVINRRGEPQAVIMGVRDFIDTFAPEPKVLKLIGEESKRKGKNKLTTRQIQTEVSSYRRERRARNGTSKGRP